MDGKVMPEPMTSDEIEDVLSSIRRLVSEDLRPAPQGAAAPGPAGKLILTPSLRVVARDRAEPAGADGGARAEMSLVGLPDAFYFEDPALPEEAAAAEPAPAEAPLRPGRLHLSVPHVAPDPVTVQESDVSEGEAEDGAEEGPGEGAANLTAAPVPEEARAGEGDDGPAEASLAEGPFGDDPAEAAEPSGEADPAADDTADYIAEPFGDEPVEAVAPEHDAHPVEPGPSAPDPATPHGSLDSVVAALGAAVSDHPQDWEPENGETGDSAMGFGATPWVKADWSEAPEAVVVDPEFDDMPPEDDTLADDETSDDTATAPAEDTPPEDLSPEAEAAAATARRRADEAEAEAVAEILRQGISPEGSQEEEMADEAEEASEAPPHAADADAAPHRAAAFEDDSPLIDEDLLREMVRDIVRQELQGGLGERITRNVRKLVRAEIARAFLTRDFE